MNINIICIGKLKERYWTEAVAEYMKRLSRFCTIPLQSLRRRGCRIMPQLPMRRR